MAPANNQPRILISRLSHIGDCILTLPLLTGLRRLFPNSKISWAVESPTQQLLKLHGDLDEIIQVEKQWIKSPRCWNQMRQRLAGNFDIAIDPQGITKSAMLCRISAAPKRYGIRGRWGRELSPWLNNCLVQPKQAHLLDRTLELLSRIAQDHELKFDQRVVFDLPVAPQGKAMVDELCQRYNFATKPVVINPGASWESKRWETERFSAVANQLFSKHGIQSLITWAGPDEFAMAKRVQNSADERATIIAPRTNLIELAALLKFARFFIGCDTGPMHLATAMATPCVGLYGTTLPTESGAYGPENIAIQKWYQSGSCRVRRNASNDAMRDISAEDVITACHEMVQKTNSRQSVAA